MSRALRRWCGRVAVPLMVALVASFPVVAAALQEPAAETPATFQQGPDVPLPPPPQPNMGPRATVHGMVKNSATGEPLPRALVRIEGDASSGSLTDGQGRFEIAAVPVGPQAFQVLKPGFRDEVAAPGTPSNFIAMQRSMSEHNVMVALNMPDVIFTMAPNNSIRGQIELSTGEPAQGIGVMLLRRAVQEGRAVWQSATAARTNSDGVYRFAGLADGVYALYTEPAMDSGMAGYIVEAGSDAQVARSGFASLFYPDAHDLAGAAKIEISGGEQAQANLALMLEPFHMVRATVVPPAVGHISAADRDGMNYTGMVMDAQGHQLPYTPQYDQKTHSMQVMLPDGTYSLLVTAVNSHQEVTFGVSGRYSIPGGSGGGPMTGQVEFSVAGHPVANLRVPLAGQQGNPVQVSVVRSAAPQPSNGPAADQVFITLSQAGGWITDGMVSTFAEGSISQALETSFMAPGSYWVHTNIAQRKLCQASFTAGGASLAREPLVLGISGASAPLSLALRDDCATLNLSLPGKVGTPFFGEEPSYTVYVVPDFDSTVDVTPLTLRPSTGGRLTLDNLTPGDYHVYTFAAPVELEYRNPAALAGLSGQALTLAPAATGNLVIEVPEH